MSKISVVRKDLIYPELSYKIIGVLFSVFNELGYGYRELYYQRALAAEFGHLGIVFREEVYCPVIFRNEIIGRQRLDFLSENKIILEIKQGDRLGRNDIMQVMGYLRSAKLQLAILARFSNKGLIFRRILNLQD